MSRYEPIGGKVLSLQFHIKELRKRFVLSLLFFCVSFLILYPFSENIFNILVYPLARLLEEQESRRLIYTGLAEAFLVHLKISLFGSIILSLPWILYQLWLFIAPGLYNQERNTFWIFLISSPILFIVGVFFSYFLIMPLAWSFFLSFEVPVVTVGLPIKLEARLGEYLSLSLQMMLAFGISFQLPIIIFLLEKAGLVTIISLINNRRYAFLFILIISAILTPPDILSQIGLSIPLYGLYELSIFLIILQKRKKYRNDRS